ncbi:hypothetical protein L1887_22416 [Cichorium endivia]|nr:hypothetical protein L1887_22416 [Cichorium endivia]
MAEGFEYHIPQQSRREKLRVVHQNHHTIGYAGDLQGCAGLGLLPFCDQSSFISSSQNLLSCANFKSSPMAAESSYDSGSSASNYRTGRAIMDNSSNESSDLQSVRDSGNNHCHFLYRHQDLRFIQHHDQAPFHGGDFVALSLSSQNTHNGTPPVGLNLQSYYGGSGGDIRRSAVMTNGPYTGYASILKGSKFLKPTQQLLHETCEVGFGIYAEKFAVDCRLMDDPPPLENLRTSVDDPSCGGVEKRKRSTLISLLDEVYKMYKQYYQQIQTVITSFENVAGLSNAAPFANLDMKAMSKHFHCLKNAITEQLQFSVKPHEHHISYRNKESVWTGIFEKGLYGQLAFVDHQPVWRPQRGLPKQAVTVLRSWLFDHFLHPYPTDADKQLLAKQTGLSRNQVSNWFINARVRLWKPMVEEIHTLESRQANRMSSSDIYQQETPPLGNSFLSHPMNQEPPSKRTRNEGPSDKKYNYQDLMERNKEHMNFYDNLSIQTGNNLATANRGLPFTLGLHQNNIISRRFLVGGLDVQNPQVGGEIIGGRFLNDFGG